MTPLRLPSLDIPDSQKRRYSEADVHSKLFEVDMAALGFRAARRRRQTASTSSSSGTSRCAASRRSASAAPTTGST